MIHHNHIELHFDVADDAQAAELGAACWEEIVSGKRTRINTAAEDTDDIMERARTSLELIVKAIEEDPGTGEARLLARFLAGLYNGNEYPFDLTDLRALDTALASACINYLNYDRMAKAEVQSHLPDGARQMHRFIAQHRIRPQLHLSRHDEHASRLHALAERLGGESDGLLKEALGDLLARYESDAFGGLFASQPSPDLDRPGVHAWAIGQLVAMPLCGATDGPWAAHPFEFRQLTCRECQTRVLHPADAPA
jgi:hypothetical protein